MKGAADPVVAKNGTRFSIFVVSAVCDLRKARNPDHHRKGFALITLIFDSQEKYLTMEDLLIELKLMCGWYVEHVRSSGELVAAVGPFRLGGR